MSLHKFRERLKMIDHHISSKAIGNMEVLAHTLELSVSGTYKFLDEMKEEGFPIAYLRKENRLYYTVPGKMIGYVFVKDNDDINGDSKGKNSGGGVKLFFEIFSTSTYSRM